jgi:hypothetical protein
MTKDGDGDDDDGLTRNNRNFRLLSPKWPISGLVIIGPHFDSRSYFWLLSVSEEGGRMNSSCIDKSI